MWHIDMLGDLQPVEMCEVCASGKCDSGGCSANYRWSEGDEGYARCGCFESYWFDRLSTHIGHGVVLKTRQPDPLVASPVIIHVRGNIPVGWLLNTGRDSRGYFVDLEDAELLQGPGWKLGVKELQHPIPARYYVGAIVGVTLLEQTREEALSDNLVCVLNGHVPERATLGGADCHRCGIEIDFDTTIDHALGFLKCWSCGTAATLEGVVTVRTMRRAVIKRPTTKDPHSCFSCGDIMARQTAEPREYCEVFGHLASAVTTERDHRGKETASHGRCLRCKQAVSRSSEYEGWS